MKNLDEIPEVEVKDYISFLRDKASTPQPPEFANELEVLMRILVSKKGYTLLSPMNRKNLHPLVIPLMKDPSDDSVIGLLHQPLKPEIDLPVVRARAKYLNLISPSVKLMVKRLVLENDFNEWYIRNMFFVDRYSDDMLVVHN